MSTEVLTDPPAVLMSSVTTNENCGQSDGTITITGSGGTGALTYSIDNGVTFQASGSFTGLAAGSYNIVTEDANGCQAAGTAVVGSTASPTASSVHTDENCAQADGTITVTGAGGTAPLTYSIDNGVTFQAGTGFTGLAAGTYDIVVEDANGCQGTGSETISNTAGPSISNISSVDPTCNGGSDGSFTVNATGGTAPLTYSSDNGVTFQAGNSFTGVSAGTYNVVVEDANGCQVNSTVTLTDPTAVAYTSSTTDENCGAGDGTISLTGSGGTGALNYSNDGGATFQVTGNFTGLAAGIYNIVVEDASGCQATGTVTVGVAAGGVAISSTTDVDPTCNGGNDGSITVNASGGAAPLSYSSDGGVTFQAGTSFTGLSAGSYNMVVEDANGCQDATTATVTDPAAGTVSASSTAENCGSFDGTITMTGGGGTLPYTYSVDGGVTFQASNNFTGLVAGLYNIVVEDANGCQAAGTQTVSSIGGANITNVATSDPSCNGDVDGTITITASGGTAPLTYSIDGGATFQAAGSFSGLGAATYAIAVVDANGCIAGSSATLTNPAVVTYSANNTDPTCNGGADGQIAVTGAGGTGALSYSIDGGVTFQATGVFTGLAAGNYNVVVEDANGCQGTGTETLNDPAAMTYSASSTNEVCGSSDGTLTITSASGTAPLSYSIDGGISFQGTGSFINLAAGAFNVVVEDANGCQVAGVETVNSTGGASITTVATTDPSCNGGTDGTITITASGGTAPLTYSIDGGGTFQASNSFTGLGAGSYAVVVADAGGCNTGGSATLTNPAVITYTASSTDEACGAADGTLTLVGSGGTGAFTYSIDGGATFQAGGTFTGLTAGAFNVVIEDANGCQTLGAEIVNSTGGASISTVVAVDPTCNGDSDGSITITATGGTAPLAYSIDGGATFQASNVFTGLASGVYILVVDDANGCAGGGSATLNDPAVVSYTAVATDETCGAADGSLVLSGAGGTGAFTYSIDGGSTFQASGSFAGLTGGTYNVVVEDANGCQATGTEVVGAIGGATILAVLSTNPLCNGDVNGYISITANGGTAPLQYSIDGGATFQATIAFSGLSAGTYTLVVEDASGCQTTTTQVLTNPPAITATVAATGANCGANDGSATATASGGTGALTYSWDDGASQTTASATNLAAGTYTCTITDANGCTTTVTAAVTNSNAPTISISSSNVTCNGDGDGGASATVSGGTAPFTYAWDDPTNQATAAATGLGGGVFTVTVTDATGCSVTQSVIIAEPATLTNSSSVMSTTCGYANGVAISTPAGGTAPYSYQWDDAGNQSLSAAVSLVGGTYTVTISDASGCVLTDNVTIGDSDSLVITVDITHESCDGFADGTIVTAMVGGSPPYTYTWNNGAATAAIADLAAGTYTVTVQDAVGCQVHDLIPLLAENVDCITIPTAISPNGDGANDTWMIEGLDLYPDAEVEIYNRWGALLFSEKGYQHDWGGTFQDEALPAGVYYFVVKVSEEEVYTGSITVLR
jgi:gliding motility-associated-like protein